MKTSQNGIDLIKYYEGLKLQAYKNTDDVWTIGYGHTFTVFPGMEITEQEAEELLRDDVSWAEDAVNKNVTVELNQSQFDALVSFTFNLGETNLRRSTLIQMVNKEKHTLVPKELTKWVYRGKQPMKGLARRRIREAELYLKE